MYNGLIDWRNEVTKVYITEAFIDSISARVASSYVTLAELESLSSTALTAGLKINGKYAEDLLSKCLEARGKGNFYNTYELFEKRNIAKVLRGIKQKGEAVLNGEECSITFSTTSAKHAMKLAKQAEAKVMIDGMFD
jgi:hypothetical protein